MRNDLPPRDRYDELSNAWRPAEARSLLEPPPPPPVRAFRRRVFLAAAAVHILIVALVVRSVSTPAPAPAPAPAVSTGDWNLEVESAGSSAVTALVYGPETGIHLITVPAEGASADEKRRMTAKLGKGEVRLISFGRSSLRIQATSPSGAKGDFIDAGARGRIITLTRSGVRTGW